MDEKEYMEKRKELDRKMFSLMGIWIVVAIPAAILSKMNLFVLLVSMASLGVIILIARRTEASFMENSLSWISGETVDHVILNKMSLTLPFVIISIVEFEILLYYSLPEAFVSGNLTLYTLLPLTLLIQYPLMKYMIKEKKRLLGNRRILRTSKSPDDMKYIIRKSLDKLNVRYEVFEKEKFTDPPWNIMVGDEMKITLEEGEKTAKVVISNIPDHMIGTERNIEREISDLI